MKAMVNEIRTAILATICLAVILCGIYPLIVWVLSQSVFPDGANGSLVVQKGIIVGSQRLSQGFLDPKYFHARPSAAGQGYDPTASGGTNLGPTSRKLIETVRQRVDEYRTENHLTPGVPIPADAVTASGSGLDPHISLKNAMLQAPRVAKARGLSEDVVLKEIEAYTEGRDLGIFGEPGVNVLLLNLALDGRL